jgi:prepilin-type N-terminal cleavage/methylation domain-containing protein
MLNKLKESKGFTLIEVVIVLAIAALIILVVLQAVAAAQRSQRDTQRKEEAGRLSAFLEQYSSNNNGGYPAVAAGSNFGTPLGTYDAVVPVKYTNGTCAAGTGAAGTDDSDDFVVEYTLTGTRTYTLNVCLEAGGEAIVKQ